MEVRPQLERDPTGGWVCRCDSDSAWGETPDQAYARWLSRFEYRCPALPINFSYGGVDSRETDRRA